MKRAGFAPGTFLALALIAASSALADDPRPSANFAGAWWIVGAAPAPWTEPRALSGWDALLLEAAIRFDNGEVEGPPALACKDARYHDTITSPQDVFGGRLSKGSEYKIAEAMRLELREIGVIRVSCGKRRFEYYSNHDGDLVIAVGKVVYTLTHLDESDARLLVAGYNGPSFDCTKAANAGEKLICTNLRLSKADREMGAAFARLRRDETTASFATVQAAQRGWLAYVTRLCGATKPLPSFVGDQNPIRDCLDENYVDRAERLTGAKVTRAGALALEPRMRFSSKAKPSTEDSDIYPWMSGGPQAAPFNAATAKSLALGRRRTDDTNLFAFGADQIPETISLYARRTYSVIRFDAKLASLQVATYDFTGGAHEVLGEHAIDWDVALGRPLSFADIFAPGAKWQHFVTAWCVKDLKVQFDEGAPAPDASAVGGVATDIGNWMFDRNEAVVHFTVYAVASFSGGEYDVKIPYRVLKPFLKPGAVVG
jgi:uncharacterized protein YecT (DUF1311 family)